MLRWIAVVIVLCVFAAALILAYANGALVTLDYVAGRVRVHLASAILGAAFVGWILGIASSLLVIFRLKRETWRLRRSLRDAEAEIRNLRNLPLKNDH
ncbi:MAG: LapA family protein [Gammaproteobacteria bacterium]